MYNFQVVHFYISFILLCTQLFLNAVVLCQHQVIAEPVIISVQFSYQIIDEDTAGQNDTFFIHLHQLVALIIAVIGLLPVRAADTAAPLSIDSIRQLYSGDVETFVEERLLPDAAKTMEALTEREQTAARCNRTHAGARGCWRPPAASLPGPGSLPLFPPPYISAVPSPSENSARPCGLLLSDSRSGRIKAGGPLSVPVPLKPPSSLRPDLMLTEDNSIEEKLRTSMREEWEDEDYAPCDC